MTRRHVVISGTGRAGTTFLVQLLTHLGLDTGFDVNSLKMTSIGRAGLETNILGTNPPYIIKSPFICDIAEKALSSAILIDHAIIPVRHFDAAAASRVDVQTRATGKADGKKNSVWGGLWDTSKADEQTTLLRLKFTQLVEVLVRHDIPMTFLWYPRHIRDPDYLYAKLHFLLGGIDLESFRNAFNKVVRPEWVHRFTPDDL